MELRHIHADGTPAATILLLHGFGEHAGRYTEFEEAAAARGFDVLSYDQPGHGRFVKDKAVVDVAELITVHRRARAQALAEGRSDNLVLFGHSMGGLVTAASALIDPDQLSAVILSGPAFRVFPEVASPVAKALYRFAHVFPGMPTAKVKAELVSRDPDVVEAYEYDPLVYNGPVSALTASSMTIQGRTALDHASLWPVTLPLLVFHGGEDRIVNIDGSREFVAAARLAGAPAALIDVPDAYHEVFNEPEAPQLRDQALSWLSDQLAARRRPGEG